MELCFSTGLLLSVLVVLCDATDVFLDTKNGWLKGIRAEHNNEYVDTYMGIRYALPPTGNRRFTAPLPPRPWTGVRQATYFRPSCPQKGATYKEDCLYLNVYTYKSKNGSTPSLPVMVYVYGGAFQTGGASSKDPSLLAQHSVVVVTFNYRLGVIGFLSTGDDAAPGNFGMLDQVMALQWVKDNIADYGGDPNRVTLFGSSAGAASVSHHILSPLSKGLFHAAIVASGSSITSWAYKTSGDNPAPVDQARFIGNKVGCTDTDTTQLVKCLRHVDIEKLLSVQDSFKTPAIRIAWSPVVENVTGFLPAPPLTLIERGDMAHVPTIRGVNKDEAAKHFASVSGISKGMSLSNAKAYMEQYIRKIYSTNRKSVSHAVEDVYLKGLDDSDKHAIRTRTIQSASDFEFYIPALRESQLQVTKTGSRVYMYEFDYRSPTSTRPLWEGVTHSAQGPYVFGVPTRGGGHWTEQDKTVSRMMMGYFTNFVKYGDPSYKGVIWKPFTITDQSYLAIGTSSVMKSNARTEEEKLWLETIPKLVHQTEANIIG